MLYWVQLPPFLRRLLMKLIVDNNDRNISEKPIKAKSNLPFFVNDQKKSTWKVGEKLKSFCFVVIRVTKWQIEILMKKSDESSCLEFQAWDLG